MGSGPPPVRRANKLTRWEITPIKVEVERRRGGQGGQGGQGGGGHHGLRLPNWGLTGEVKRLTLPLHAERF